MSTPEKPTPDDDVTPADATPEDDMRRKFREALERKQSKGNRPGPASEDDGGAKSHGKDAQQQRMFRRKSGG